MNPHLGRTLATGALVPVILLAGLLPAHASTGPADDRGTDSAPVLEGADPAAGRLPAASSDVAEPGGILATEPGPERILIEETERPVAPGLDLRSFQWLDAGGFLRGDVLTAQLGTEGLSLDYLDNGAVTSPGPLSASADREGAVAGVNGDFFDINNSGAALGAGLAQDGPVKGANPGRHNAVGIDTEGLARLTQLYLEGEIVTPDGTHPLRGLNQTALAKDQIGAYTTLWGAYTRDRATAGLARKHEVIVTDGVVTAVSPTPGAGRLPENAIALVGREAGADALAALEVGDEVDVTYGMRSTAGEMAVAVGGMQQLVRDGKPQVHADKSVHPRTAVGFSEDRRTMFLATVDGRMADSRGMSMDELGEFMAELGAHTALNLDGGGSSTLVAREVGEDAVTVENTPSDGGERHVPNGLALFAAQGSGNVTGLRLVPAADDADPAWRRVFPGLTRDLDALGHDETYAPVEGDPVWTATPAAVGKIAADGVFTAARSGDATVTARQQAATGELAVTVLGELVRTRPTTSSLAIKGAGDSARFGILGYDEDGFEAPIEPADVTLDYDTSKITVEPDGAAGFVVTPVADSAGVVVTATVGDVVTYVPVSVGLESQVVATFDDAADWSFSTARGAGSLAPTEGRDGGTALEISYDFTRSTATRTANARAPENIVIEGQPQSIGLWVRGDGRGQWWSFSVLDANGTYYPLYGPHITWEGWRYVEVDVPQNIPFPMTVYRFGIIETVAAKQYSGSVAIDDITVKVAPHVQTPAAPAVADEVVVTDGTAVDDGDHSFAVVSDAQFTAANQSLVPAARRTLREAVAAEPDFVVINGDWIDTAFPDDLALARTVIEEEIGDAVPWYYVPGNHEILGPGDVAAWEAEFGPAHQSFVHGGTQYVLLDSSTGTLQGGGFDQWQRLRTALDSAAADAAVNGVVVLTHMPTHDPAPVKTSQLASAVEVGVVEDWLADFRRETGKGAAFVGSHVGSFSAASVDGVPYVVNGNAGKAPSTDPADGGFSGWTLVGINPAAAPLPVDARHRATREAENPWFEVEMRPHVDSLAVEAPVSLAVGGEGAVTAEVVQGGRTVPVTYPVSADWASAEVAIGDEQVLGSHVATFDPATGTLTGLRPGAAELSVTVNGVTEAVTVEITA